MENDDRMEDSSSNKDDFMTEVQKRQQETEDMNRILGMVSPSDRLTESTRQTRNTLEFSGLQEELEKIQREQDEVLQKLDNASRLDISEPIPEALTRLVGTWKIRPDQEVTPSTSSVLLPPAFLYKYMWFKLEGRNLHCWLFTGYDHERTVDTLGLECDGELEGTKKMTYVEKDRLMTSYRRVNDGMELMRIEMFVDNDMLYYIYIFQKDHFRYIRAYEKAFNKNKFAHR